MDVHRDFVRVERGSSSITIRSSLAEEPILKVLANPDFLFELPGCQIIKNQLKIKVARIPFEFRQEIKTVYLKRYNAFSWRYRLGSLLQESGAAKSLKGGQILAEAGVRTAAALAAVETRSCGMLSKSFFLTEEIENGQTVDAYWRDQLLPAVGRFGTERRRRFLASLGELFSLLHRKRVYHNDLKDANIIVVPAEAGEDFYLLDLEGIRIVQPLTVRRRIKNLVQLNRTFGRGLSRSQKFRLLKSYLGSDFSDPGKRRFWIERIIQASFVGDRRSLRKQRAP